MVRLARFERATFGSGVPAGAFFLFPIRTAI